MQTSKEVFEYLKQRNEKVLEHLKGEFSCVRAGRANPKILDRIMVNYYGSLTPLNQMANITVPEPRMLLINVWDVSALKDVVKAIQESDIGINPADDGKNIRLVFPILTEERRKELVKSIKKMAEESKISARNERKEALDIVKNMKKENLLTEDDVANCEKEIQKIVDNVNAQIDKLLAEKEKEILSV